MRLVQQYIGELQTCLFFAFMFKVKLAFIQVGEEDDGPDEVINRVYSI